MVFIVRKAVSNVCLSSGTDGCVHCSTKLMSPSRVSSLCHVLGQVSIAVFEQYWAKKITVDLGSLSMFATIRALSAAHGNACPCRLLRAICPFTRMDAGCIRF